MTNAVKKSIILASKSLFGEKGFEATSIRDISKRAKVNVAMIAYYFGCKEKLYLACLSEYTKEKAEAISLILTEPKDARDFEQKLKQMLDLLVSSYEEDAPLLKILMREMQSDHKKKAHGVIDVASSFFFTIRDFFQKAIEAKIIKNARSADLVTIVFVGALSKPIHSELAVKRVVGLTLKDKKFQKEYTEHLLNIFIRGVLE